MSQYDIPSIFINQISSIGKCEEVVKWVNDLPPFPHIASQALSLVESPDATANKLSSLLGKDVALAARTLKIANSAMYARQREITTINQAIMLIGFQTLKGIIIAASMKQLARNPSETETMIWENSTATAIASQILNKALKKNLSDEFFILSLLHDLGKLVLVRQSPENYAKVVALVSTGISFVAAELQIFGFSHPVVGALVLRKWNFPAETFEIVLAHHDLQILNDKPLSREKAEIINLADLLAHCAGYGHPEGYLDQLSNAKNELKRLNISISCEDIILEIKEKFEAEGASFAKA